MEWQVCGLMKFRSNSSLIQKSACVGPCIKKLLGIYPSILEQLGIQGFL